MRDVVLPEDAVKHPYDVAHLRGDEVVVANWGSHSVVVVDVVTEQVVRRWGDRQCAEDGQFNEPDSVFVSGRNLYVLDRNSARVQV